MFTNVLVVTDLSETAGKVLNRLRELKAMGVENTHLVHCFNVRDVGTLGHRLTELAEPKLEEQRMILEKQGFEATAQVLLGLYHIEIEQQAKEHQCSLIVTASEGFPIASDINYGSVSGAIVHSATRPVLVLRMKTRADQAGGEYYYLRHVVYPTDFSDNAEHALEYLEKIAQCGPAKITLLHVQDKSRIDRHMKDKLEEFNRIDFERLSRIRDELLKISQAEINIEIPYGLPKTEIAEFAANNDASMILMGSQGRGFVGDILLGSVSHSVVKRATEPVMLIPAIK